VDVGRGSRGDAFDGKLKTDLALTLVEEDLGHSTAIGIARPWHFSSAGQRGRERASATSGVFGQDSRTAHHQQSPKQDWSNKTKHRTPQPQYLA
jgi:transcriptional regulator GlxA family with amidase domain